MLLSCHTIGMTTLTLVVLMLLVRRPGATEVGGYCVSGLAGATESHQTVWCDSCTIHARRNGVTGPLPVLLTNIWA
jgi:hypothetical protein